MAIKTISQSYEMEEGSRALAFRKFQGAVKVVGWVIFTLYMTGLITMLTRRASTFPVALSESSDAANAMNVLNRTTWLSDNEFTYYGPLYYRLAKSLLNLDPVYRIADRSNTNVRDKSAHIALMLTSFFALMLMSLILGARVGPDWSLGWLSVIFMFAFLSNTELWIDFAVDNHPDLLLSMLIALATSATINSLRPVTLGQTNSLWGVGTFWGLSLLTKLTAATFFVGAIVIIMAAAWRGRCLVRAGIAVGVSSFLTYLVVGFPQSLNVLAVINSMIHVASVTVKTFDVVFWKNMLLETAVLPLMVVFGGALLFAENERTTEGRPDLPSVFLALAFLIPGIAFVSLFWVSYQDHMRHYILPVVAALSVTAVPCVQRAAFAIYRWAPTSLKLLSRVVGLLTLIAVVVIGRRWYHDHTTSRIINRFELQEEAEMVQKSISDDLSSGKIVVADPFSPIDLRMHAVFEPRHGFTSESLGQLMDAQVFVSSRWYHERFLRTMAAPWTLLQVSEADYVQRQDFYRGLEGDSFVDDSDRVWKLRFRTPLGWAIWDNDGGTLPLTSREIQRMAELRNRFTSRVLLDLDFSHVEIKDGRQRVISKSGQEALVEGPVVFVEGPRPNLKGLVIQAIPPYTRLTPPPLSLSLGKGTFAAWAKLADPKKPSSILLSVNTVFDTPRPIYFERYASGQFSLKFNGQPMADIKSLVTGGQWHHYVLTWEDGAQLFYVDGHLVGRASFATPKTDCRTFSLGWLGDNNDESQWPGPLAEVVTVGRPLNAEEALALYRVGIRGKPALSKD